MCALYMNKYRIGSKRLKGYDYTSPGKYFITICTKNKIPYFGKIENGEMILSKLGKIAEKFWQEIPAHFPFIELDNFIVMPDHMHGIISINTNPDSNIVETMHASFLQTNFQNPNKPIAPEIYTNTMENNKCISPKPGSLGSIIGSYKSAVSKTIHRSNSDFKWLSRFYDHLIRSDHELSRIRKYIRENPQNFKNL